MTSTIAIVGAGPSGLMAAETLAAQGQRVVVYERMPSVARKFLMAGRGGLNLTHSETPARFLDRYGDAAPIRAAIEAFPPQALRAWADALAQETFVGSSGRVFPKAMKASPLLRAWLRRLDAQGVRIETRSEWRGWSAGGDLLIAKPDGMIEGVAADAAILACGGASWPRLGANGDWAPILDDAGVSVTPLQPSNVGVVTGWSEWFATRFAGAPLKRIAITLGDRIVRGEAIVTRSGLEGGAIYALARALRAALERGASTTLLIDLRPDLDARRITEKLTQGRAKDSFSTRLKRAAGLSPPAIGLLREATGNAVPANPAAIAALIKRLPVRVTAPQGLERAISTAGGVSLEAVDERMMLRARPGTFVAGEMLDWDAPTGGYLLQACFATGRAAAAGALAWLERSRTDAVRPRSS